MGLLHYCTFRLEAANDAQNVRVKTTRRKFIKMTMYYCSTVNNRIALDNWRYNNPVYKLMTNNEQTATGVN